MTIPSQSLYADGGVLGRNPSRRGGTLAWCLVENDVVLASASRIVRPFEVELPTVTNNMTELLAVLEGMRSLPEGWMGSICTDSQVTMYRLWKVSKPCKPSRIAKGWVGVPYRIVEAFWTARQRLAKGVRIVHLSGHPTEEELLLGRGKGGRPVSRFNVLCDQMCQEAGR